MTPKRQAEIEFEEEWRNNVPNELLEYDSDELEEKETLGQGQADDLKVEEEIDGYKWRVWLCRCDTADGMPYNDQVTIEVLDPRDYRWKEAARYPG